MNFDPAIAAQAAFKEAMAGCELGHDAGAAAEAEEVFSARAGAEAREAYHRLLALGQRHPDAAHFQAFLIYISWQQVTEETTAANFQRGLRLCQLYLRGFPEPPPALPATRRQIEALQESFRHGLGLGEEDEHQMEYDRDAFKGGD